MFRFLLTARWAIATTVVIVLAALFVNLGLWQLRRADERLLDNAVMSARLSDEPMSLQDLLAAVGSDPSSLEYRRVRVTGRYRPDLELLIRNQTNAAGAAGFNVVTPFEYGTDRFVLVNRGWVPLEMDTPPVGASPPGGEVTISGVIRLTQLRPAVGPVEPDGILTVASRIDIDRLAQQMPGPVAPVWIQSTDETLLLPVSMPVPSFDDAGPHTLYAIQWFAFALIGVVGYVLLVREQALGRGRRKRSVAAS